MAQTNTLDTAVQALNQRVSDLSMDATPEQLAYLGKAVESIGGRSTVLEVMQTGTEQNTILLETAKNEKDALTALASDQTDAFTTLAGSKITALTQEGTEQVTLVKQEGSTQITAVRQEGQQQLAAVQNAGASVTQWLPVGADGNPVPFEPAVKAAAPTLVKPGTLPFIFGVISRYGDGGNGYGQFTSELGQFYNGQALNQLKLISGYHGWGLDYRAFSTLPSLQFITGSNGQFVYRNFNNRYGYAGTNMYQYPRALMGVIFVKNTTNADITRNIWFGGSSGWSSGYEGMGVKTLTPNGTNADPAKITALTEANRWAYSSSAWATGTNVSIVVPANTTVAIVLYASSYFYTDWNGYQFHEQLVMQNMRNFFGNGLEVDLERTLKAHTNPDGSADPVDIWK